MQMPVPGRRLGAQKPSWSSLLPPRTFRSWQPCSQGKDPLLGIYNRIEEDIGPVGVGWAHRMGPDLMNMGGNPGPSMQAGNRAMHAMSLHG